MRAWHGLVAIGLTIGIAACGPVEDRTANGGDAAARAGETTYQRFCFSCHASGAAGAPRVGDVAAWSERIDKGEDALLATTIAGIPPAMPPRGMCLQCTDADLAAAISYMVDNSRSD